MKVQREYDNKAATLSLKENQQKYLQG